MTPADLADAYFQHMRAQDLEGLASLFAPDAVMVFPDGREAAGLEAIRGMYRHVFGAGGPSPSPAAMIVGPDGAAVEIETTLPDGSSRRTANFFHLGADGRIARLSVYKRGDW
jgi:uncharacterized protein (TIGR02246 family)